MTNDSNSDVDRDAVLRDNQEMAERLLDTEEGDVVEVTFVTGGEEKTTRQKIVDVTQSGFQTEIFGENLPDWNPPSIQFTVGGELDPELKPTLRHPFGDTTVVQEFVKMRINPEKELVTDGGKSATGDLHEYPEELRFRGAKTENLKTEYGSVDDLAEAFRQGADFTDVPGVGRRTRDKIHRYITEHYPEAEKERRENDEGICTEFTTDHGIEDPEEDVFYWSWFCPRCGGKNPMKGDVSGFRNRPYRCTSCSWVALLPKEELDEFADEVDA